MAAKILNGKKISEEVLSGLKEEVRNFSTNPYIVVILVGHNQASKMYIKKKEKVCKQIGINFNLITFKKNVPGKIIQRKIEELNKDNKVNAILIQLPLPKNLKSGNLINTISPNKDVDGLTEISRKKLKKGDETFASCTPKGIIKLLERENIPLKDKKIVLVGYGYLVGQPLALMLKNRKLKFIVCDDTTKDLKEKTKQADILISATGVPCLIKANYVKQDVVIIDVGIAKINKKTVGDVDFEKVKEKASWITPIPGGVGPVTIAMLIENIIKAYKLQNNISD